ncbi:hypothetical protein ig2599ANME_1915 [groundwater metagenome]
MRKSIYYGLSVILILAIIIAVAANSPKSNAVPSSMKNGDATGQSSTMSADKIEVVHFHATQQCWSCITVGEYALKIIKEKFPQEYENGKIVFKDINRELPENKDMVIKYQARGSSLFVNAIRNGKDNIEEDITVWRLVSNENQFISYFQNKLNNLLGK